MYYSYLKLLIFVVLFPFCVIDAQEYEVKTIIVEVELPKYKVTNDSFQSIIDSLILSHNYNTEYREDYVYLTLIKKLCVGYNISITLIRPTFISNPSNLGFFRRQNALFLIQGANPDSLFVDTGKKGAISYKKNVVELNGKYIDYDDLKPEEFMSWILSYIHGKFRVINKKKECYVSDTPK